VHNKSTEVVTSPSRPAPFISLSSPFAQWAASDIAQIVAGTDRVARKNSVPRCAAGRWL